MSLSIGQSAEYINNIENGINLPSMLVFFYICDYLEMSPMEFFDINSSNPVKLNKLTQAAKILNNRQIEILIMLAEELKK